MAVRPESGRRYRICEHKAIIVCVQASFFPIALTTPMAQVPAVGDRTALLCPPTGLKFRQDTWSTEKLDS
nr:hypothetical protein [Nostoc sp. ZfuVER08]